MMNKRFLLPVLAIITVFAMFGCQGPNDPQTPPASFPVTVTFNSYDGGASQSFGLSKDEALGNARWSRVTALQTRAGYEFKGWSLTKGGDAVTVNAYSKWTANATYYGLWAVIVGDREPITITYNMNNCPAVQVSPYEAQSNRAIGVAALPDLTPGNGEFKWQGWSITIDGDIIDAGAIFRSDTTLYARWGDYVITYDLNGFVIRPNDRPADYPVINGAAIGQQGLPNILPGNLANFYTWLGWSTSKDGSIVSAAETFLSDTTLYARYEINPPSYTHIPAELLPYKDDMPYDLHPLRTPVPANFIRGADISNCLEIELYNGTTYRNFENRLEDIMKILTENGINYVRIRLWVDPEQATTGSNTHYAGDGNNHIGVTKMIAARAKAAGMKFLLNFHYSDYWADPGQQEVPDIWKNIPTRRGLLDALYDYTAETLQEFIAAGAEPDMVAIGNEIRRGILSGQRVDKDGTGYVLSGWGDFSAALAEAAQAVRFAAPNAKIMVHWDNGGNAATVNSFQSFTGSLNGTPATDTEVDYDVVGLSWYCLWSDHGSIDALYNNIREFKTRFGKEVVVCENGAMWTVENFDGMGNYAGTVQEEGAVNSFTNTNGFTGDSEVAFANRDNGTPYVPSTPENQARITRAAMDAIVAAGGDGVMWWGADWIALPDGSGLRSNSEMATLFESTGVASTNGKALPVLKVLGGIRGADVMKPGKITGLKADPDLYKINVTWTAVDSAVASKYQLERAASASGPWTTLGENLTTDEYEDTGLTKETPYYYRIRGWNQNGWGNWSDTLETGTYPFIPRGVNVAVTIDTVTLTWNVLTDATRYEVSRSADEGVTWTVLDNSLTAVTYTNTGLTPETSYSYRLRGYNGSAWGEYCAPVETATLPLSAVSNFRVTGVDADTYAITLGWNVVNGISGYEIHFARQADRPTVGDFSLLVNNLAANTATYTHDNLEDQETYWYMIRAVYAVHGSGPWSPLRTATVGGADLTATVNMNSWTLDDDFEDPQKAASSDDKVEITKSDGSNYQIDGLYAANDDTYLYVALLYYDRPAMWQNDWITIWIDNTASTTGGAETKEGNFRIAANQTIIGTPTIEYSLSHRQTDLIQSTATADPADVTRNGAWTGTANIWAPPLATDAENVVIKYRIPLANIGYASGGDELRIVASHTQGWDGGGNPNVGGLIPAGIITDYAPPAYPNSSGDDRADNNTVSIDMGRALSYTVK